MTSECRRTRPGLGNGLATARRLFCRERAGRRATVRRWVQPVVQGGVTYRRGLCKLEFGQITQRRTRIQSSRRCQRINALDGMAAQPFSLPGLVGGRRGRLMVCVTGGWAGVDSALGQEKLKGTKMLENVAKPQLTRARYVGGRT